MSADRFWNTVTSVPREANEAAVELQVVQPLLSALGFESGDIGVKVAVVLREGSKRGRPYEADFVAYSGEQHDRDTSLLVVEAKVPGASLEEARQQGESYAMALRAPAMLLTDGVVLQVWQVQATLESKLMLECAINQLKAHRGKLEQLIGKSSLTSHAASLQHKKLSATANLRQYELAELHRTEKVNHAITRTLRRDNGELIGSECLLETFSQGVLVSAPSGFGKTTLAAALLRQAIERRSGSAEHAIPIDMPLLDLHASDSSPLEFACARITPHVPQVTLSAIEDLARRHGLLLVCDGFDRLEQAARAETVSQLRRFARDYPKSMLFVFSRGSSVPDLSLPRLQLQPLEDRERHLMASNILGSHFPLSSMPRLLTDLSEIPLLLERIVAFWSDNRRFPTRLEQLFEHWKTQLLEGSAALASAANMVICDIVLERLAHEMGIRPLIPAAALRLTKACDAESSIFDALIGCGMLRLTMTSVEFVHEGLADHFRARRLLAMPFSQLQSTLSPLSMDEDSLLPILLVAQVKDDASRAYIWERLREMSLARYIDAIRFSEDSDETFTTTNLVEGTRTFTDEMADSIATLVDAYFPQVAAELRGCISNQLDGVDALRLIATITPAPQAYLHYALQPAAVNAITIGPPPAQGGYHGMSLDAYRIGIEGGRYLGAIVVRNGINDLIQSRRFSGGALLANERAIGRLRLMHAEYNFDIDPQESLESIVERLRPRAHMIVSNSYARPSSFTIQSLIKDLELLLDQGQQRLDWWWLQYGTFSELATDQGRAEAFLREHYLRTTALYVEIVTASFARVSMRFSPFQLLPMRWEVVLVPGQLFHMPTQYWRWMPVSTEDDAGVDIAFATEAPEEFLRAQTHSERLSSELMLLGRSASRYSLGGFCPFPEIGVRDLRGRLTGETSVMRDVVDYLKDDLKSLFQDLTRHGVLLGDMSLD